MFFLIKGQAAMVIEMDDILHPFVVINDGYYFGEIDILLSEDKLYLFTVKALKRCDLLTLQRNAL